MIVGAALRGRPFFGCAVINTSEGGKLINWGGHGVPPQPAIVFK